MNAADSSQRCWRTCCLGPEFYRTSFRAYGDLRQVRKEPLPSAENDGLAVLIQKLSAQDDGTGQSIGKKEQNAVQGLVES